MLRPALILARAAMMAALCAAASFAVTPAVVDNCNDGDAENMFVGYWYVYDDVNKSADIAGAWDPVAGFLDSLGGGNSLGWTNIDIFAKNGEYASPAMTGADRSGAVGGKSFRGEFSFGDKGAFWGTGANDFSDPEIAVGTGLISEPRNLDLTGVKTITYWARASESMKVASQVATNQFNPIAPAYHEVDLTVGTEWAQYTIEFDSLKQPVWANDEKKAAINKDYAKANGLDTSGINLLYTFDPAKVAKLQWAIGVEKNTGLRSKTGWIEIDDIVVDGYNWEPEAYCPNRDLGKYVAAAKDYDVGTGEAWYATNDSKDRLSGAVFSTPTAHATIDPSNLGTLILTRDAYNTRDDSCAAISYTLGESFISPNPDTVSAETTLVEKPSVGIAVDLTEGTDVFSATDSGHTGVYLEYCTTFGADKFIRFEVADTTNKYNMKRVKAGIERDGVVHRVFLPGTDGAWRAVAVNFNKFELPYWYLVKDPTTKLDTKSLKAMAWVVEGAAGETGTFAIDSVRLIEDPSAIAIRPASAGRSIAAFSTVLTGSSLVFTVPGALKGTIELVSMSGRTVAKTVAKTGAVISLNGIASGSYIARMIPQNGAAVSQNICIVR